MLLFQRILGHVFTMPARMHIRTHAQKYICIFCLTSFGIPSAALSEAEEATEGEEGDLMWTIIIHSYLFGSG